MMVLLLSPVIDNELLPFGSKSCPVVCFGQFFQDIPSYIAEIHQDSAVSNFTSH